ncbi:putative serine protease MucD [Treponema primitia ZAS-2]|uniref:Putative serine protease MucD n=1 Tax=Treponema primitia (strain ATCC BAA-887 / DSM 12427 / ZAS-2) TaxID=545694 RepID=F5YGR0_TREPZ|nr:Do family serine endopeptidase [Treponema primitia]AEF85294.1 putative serine protease MucD [Treponema primitia ZAS-2]
MNFTKSLASKNFFFFNLVLLGAIFGFSLAFLSFSCSTPVSSRTAKAQENPGYSDVVIPEDALRIAEGLQTAFRSVADKVLPSVVEIKTVSIRRQQTPNFNGIPWEFFFGPRDGNGGNQEREYRSQGLGSGIIVRHSSDTYYVLTNNHVVEAANEIVVALNDGKEISAELVGKDERKDLALVSFKSSETLPIAVLGDSDAVRVGDWAIAVGNPLGFMSSVTMGIVSAVGRTGGPGGNINDFIQTDTSINQGNSGGALVNIRGDVIGINTWIASNSSGGSVGLGFAIPINNAKRTIDDFINSGEVSYGWLGVSLAEADKETTEALGLDGKRGALAAQVFLGSPADKGGIQPGDFITHINGREMRGVNPLMLAVGDLKPGEQASFTVFRSGATLEIKVRIEARNNETATENNKLWPGLMAAPINDTIRNAFNLDKNIQGIVAVQIVDKSPASVVGLQRGDRIIGINGETVRNLADFYRLLREKAGKELWFEVVRGENTLETLKYKR